MIIGFILLGWIGGLVAATLFLTTGGGSLLAAFGVFVLAANLTVLLCAARHAAGQRHLSRVTPSTAHPAPGSLHRLD